MDLEVTRADRGLDAPRARRRPRPAHVRRPIRFALKKRSTLPSRRTGGRGGAQRLGLGARTRPQPLELAGRAGQDDRHGPTGLGSTKPGPCRPARAIAPRGRVACLLTPESKSVYGRRSRSAIVREISSISSWSALIEHELPSRRTSHQLGSAIVVGRAGALPRWCRDRPRGLPRARAQALLPGRRRSRCARARSRARAPARPGTARSGRFARRARARCP